MKKIIIVLCLFVLAGCNYSEPAKMTINDAAPMLNDTENAILVLVTETDIYGINAYLDQEMIGAFHRDRENNQGYTYSTTSVVPGEHYLVTEENGNTCTGLFDFKKGKTYFIGQNLASYYSPMGGVLMRPSGFYPLSKEDSLKVIQEYDRVSYSPGSEVRKLDPTVYKEALDWYRKDVKENPDFFKDILNYDGVVL